MTETVLVTGGAGFIGSNFSIDYKKKHLGAKVIALDNLVRRGSELNLPRLKENGVLFVHGDVRKRSDLDFKEKIDVLVECSAEPSVIAGQENPAYVIDVNLNGAINCLEVARKHGSKFVFLSTSRVYPHDVLNNLKYNEDETRLSFAEESLKKGIPEDFRLDGVRSIYGATKLSAELMIREYGESYNLPFIINRCGVVAGPWQMGKVDQGVFALWLARHHFKKPLSYTGFGGTGKQVRDVLHVDDLCELIDLELNKLNVCNKKTYNAGGGEYCLSLLETTKLCEEITGNKIPISSSPKNRPADIPVYVSDCSMIEKELGWKPKREPRKTLEDIHSWILSNEDSLRERLC